VMEVRKNAWRGFVLRRLVSGCRFQVSREEQRTG
jgi:hypothetical protein